MLDDQGGTYICDMTYPSGETYGLVLADKKYENFLTWSLVDHPITTSIYDGYLNTIMMNSAKNSQAAEYCLSLNIDGFDDWFIPSLKEFDAIINHVLLKNKYHEFEETWYWSSTQDSKSRAVSPFLFISATRYSFKRTSCRIRPIRKFKL